ncbi:hypothetical protein M9Y10_042745 [Tritrichomonas musculus]|uniref:Uncharacterized protein n=1 Tax=Tritrichomonas musculus TaxID=1915356 RepID=A0ABR2JYD0_9EUKA
MEEQQLKERVDKLEEENRELRQLIQLLFKTQNVPYSIKPHFLIPTGQHWSITKNQNESKIKHGLMLDGTAYEVQFSNLCSNDIEHNYPYFLFLGKNEIENGGLKWSTDEGQNSVSILIEFKTLNYPILTKANVISMTSRKEPYHSQAPTSFTIFCCELLKPGELRRRTRPFLPTDPSFNRLQVKKSFTFSDIHWEPNENKKWTFPNCIVCNFYVIIFHSCGNAEKVFGLAELNLGQI